MKNKIVKFILSPNYYAKYIGVNIGVGCTLNKEISFGSEPYLITIGDKFYCSTGIKFITHDGSVNVLRNLHPELKEVDLISEVIVGSNVFLGCNVTVLPGTVIGDNVIVGACSVIRGKLKSNSVYAGIPAKRLMSVAEYKEKKKNHFVNTKLMTKKEKRNYLLMKNKIKNQPEH
ncbi:acyltransferase [Enterovibrio norvegicus]|uniref:acyltransferase n=1 Tax=Enterovibrio norvegicus TaxID=188144 RepID=UPI0013D682C5|nr:acyltransferase [Enterovibrio norvegicus]